MIKGKFLKITAIMLASVMISGAMIFAEESPLPLEIEVGAVDDVYGISSSYKSGRYYSNLQALHLSGDQARDVVAIAMSQLGYHEGNSEGELDGLGSTGTRDFVEYNVLYGKLDNDQGHGMSYGYYWCASFVNWCLRMAKVDEDASGSFVSCQAWYSDSKKADEGRAKIFYDKGADIPVEGDIIFFKDPGSSSDSTHVGLVRYSAGGRVYTIEGNTSNGSEYSSNGEYVALKSYDLADDYIVGYARPRYEANKTARRVDRSGAFLSLGDYITTDDITLYADGALSASSGMSIPAHSVLEVTEISDGYLKVKAEGAEGYVSRGAAMLQLTTSESIYTVNYVDESGTPVFNPQYRRAGEQRYIYSNSPSREKHGFVGWRLQGSADSMFKPGDKMPNVTNDLTFVAVFDGTRYLVSFLEADGKTIIDQVHGYYGKTFTFPDAPETPEGYVFVGWSAGTEGVITGNATYTVAFMTEEEFLAANATEAAETEAEEKSPIQLDDMTREIISCVAAGAIMLIIPAVLLPILLVPTKKKRKK